MQAPILICRGNGSLAKPRIQAIPSQVGQYRGLLNWPSGMGGVLLA